MDVPGGSVVKTLYSHREWRSGATDSILIEELRSHMSRHGQKKKKRDFYFSSWASQYPLSFPISIRLFSKSENSNSIQFITLIG